MNSYRRNFIKTSLIGAGLLACDFLSSCKDSLIIDNGTDFLKTILKEGDVILFQGDSITDGRREAKNKNPNDIIALGSGFVALAAKQLLNTYSEKKLKIYNRGLSGNRLPDLQKRWKEDTIEIRPNILSILIGVNDFWRTVDQGAKTTVEDYRSQYRKLMEQTLSELPNIKTIICEPFAFKGVGYVSNAWYPNFLEYQQVTLSIAKEFNSIYIPFQKMFDNENKPSTYWTSDGIHPNTVGNEFLASVWMDAIQY
jgi:lysophospholipase L1-like esterase